MALRVRFGDVIEAVRDEARLSSNTSRGLDHKAYIKRLIRRHYQMLAEQYDWMHLRVTRYDETDGNVVLKAGERFYDFPIKLNPQRIEKVWVRNGTGWMEMDYGIDPGHYSELDSDAGDRADPPMQWRFHTEKQFEVWPVPASDDNCVVRFEGQKKVEALVDDDSRLDMDDILVSLYAAGEILAGTKQEDSKVKLAAAAQRLAQLRAGYSDKRRICIGRGAPDAPLNRETVIRVAYVR